MTPEDHQRQIEEYQLRIKAEGRAEVGTAVKLLQVADTLLDHALADPQEINEQLPALLSAIAALSDSGSELWAEAIAVDKVLLKRTVLEK